MELKIGRTGVILVPLVFFLFLLCLIYAVHFRHGTNRLDFEDRVVRRRMHSHIQGEEEGGAITTIRRRMYLRGPGSYPPRCTSKCGDCTPCSPVHVPVPPGTPVTAEYYYPEAWRCKCGNKLYLP